MDEDAGSMARVFNSGAGAIVTKSIGLKPRNGYPNPTVVELEYGIQKSKFQQRSQEALVKFLRPLRIINLDYSSVTESAVIRAQLENKGTPIGSYDLLIAGIVLSRGMTLVTNNMKEFERVEGLLLENWIE